MGCPLAARDLALDAVIAQPDWSYLAPLKGLRPVWRTLREPQHRLKKTGLDAAGAIASGKNKQRMGPLTFEARSWRTEDGRVGKEGVERSRLRWWACTEKKKK